MTLPSPRRRAFKGRFPVVDALFLAGSAALAAAMIVYALSGEAPERQGFYQGEDRIVIEGEALVALIPGPGVRADFDYGEGAAYVTSASSIEIGAVLSAGAAILLPPEFEQAVIGRNLRIRVVARAAAPDVTNPLEVFHAGYFTTGGQGDSGWRAFPVDGEYREYTFDFAVSPDAIANDEEWVGVWPDAQGLGRGLYVRHLSVEILDDSDQ